MNLAVKKEPGVIPGSGFHYMLMPLKLDEWQVPVYKLMGFIIIEVPDDRGEALLQQARHALHHQMQIAVLADAAERSEAEREPLIEF